MVTTVSESVSPRVETLEHSTSYGKFVLEPLAQGFGTTLGNALRRVLLSSLPGYAVTAVRIENVQHEYSTLPHVKEDVTEFLLNVKQIRLQPVVVTDQPVTMQLEWRGEGVVRAGDIRPAAECQVVNKDLALATVDSPEGQLNAELRVEYGVGYQRADNWEDRETIGWLPVDALFSPVRKINYAVEHTRIGGVTDYDRLVLEVWTDQTVDPEDGVRQAAQVLINHFNLLAAMGRQTAMYAVERRSLATPVSDDLYNMPVEDLKLTSRTLNCLRRGSIRTVGEVLARSKEELLALRNFGERSLEELYTRLREVGASIGDEKEERGARQEEVVQEQPSEAMTSYSFAVEEEEQEEEQAPSTGRTFYPD